jgi:ribose 5-phosphate isomerase B
MRIAFGADDTSPTVDAVAAHLAEAGHEVVVADPTLSWPAMARFVAEQVAAGQVERGIVMCWTGTGTSIAANKVAGVRAALAWEPWIAKHARLWNDANVLALSLKRTAPDVAVEIVDAFLAEPEPDPGEREHIAALENVRP